MAEITVYYATNRRHRSRDRWRPTSYSGEPSRDGSENLRFGRVRLPYGKAEVDRELERDCGFGSGDGGKLSAYLYRQRSRARIEAFEERLDKFASDTQQASARFGSSRAFGDLQAEMDRGCDVLQAALGRTGAFSTGGKLPRIFNQVFLCAPDVADDVFDSGMPLRALPEMAEQVTVYHNRGDLAMPVSDYTKGNSDRLGWGGANRPAALDGRVHQVDCSPIVAGLMEHSYYLCGRVNDDLAASVGGLAPDAAARSREPVRHGWPNVWRMV